MSVEGDTSRRYIVVTPCKNEDENLPDLIESMVAQTVRPVVWAIVDDGSTDNTPEIIEDAMKTHEWIQSIRLNSTVRDLGLHFARITKDGFDAADRYCVENGIEYGYVGKVDGDLTLPPDFFESLIKEFERDSKLGVASGGTRHIIGNRVRYAKLSVDEPSGGHMLMRRECFEEFGGFPLTYAIDAVMKAKARIRGWKTRRFEDNVATEIRDVNAAEGYWKGFIHNGETHYYLNHHPFHVFFEGVKYLFRRPHYIGIAYLLGYSRGIIKRKERTDDPELKEYFRSKWKTVIKREVSFIKMHSRKESVLENWPRNLK